MLIMIFILNYLKLQQEPKSLANIIFTLTRSRRSKLTHNKNSFVSRFELYGFIFRESAAFKILQHHKIFVMFRLEG